MQILHRNYLKLPLFSGLTVRQFEKLRSIMEVCRHPKDILIFEQGQPATFIYILLEGEILIRHKPYDGPLLDVAHIASGGVFGWSAMLGREIYTSETLALSDSLSYRIRRNDLSNFCKKNPELGNIFLDRLASVISERLSNTHTEIFSFLSSGMSSSTP